MLETYNQTQYDRVLDSLEFVVDDPLAFEPGTNFQYSSFGYNMFSAALVSAAGVPFLELMQRSIFEPLAMTHTSPDYQDRPVDNVVGFYIQVDDVLIRSPGVNNSYKWAGGGRNAISDAIAVEVSGDGRFQFVTSFRSEAPSPCGEQVAPSGGEGQYLVFNALGCAERRVPVTRAWVTHRVVLDCDGGR